MRSLTITFGTTLLCTACLMAGCSSLEEYNVQEFRAGDATCLSGKQLYFGHHQFDNLDPIEKSSAYFHYSRFVTELTALPVDPASHAVIDFSQGAPFELALPNGLEVTYYRETYRTLFIGSDGTIAFGAPGTGNGNLMDAFSSNQLSLLPVDATAEGATVRYAVNSDEIVITFENVDGSSFQTALILTGRLAESIFVSYLVVSEKTQSGVVGLPDPEHPALHQQTDLETFLASPRFVPSDLCQNSPLDPIGPDYFQ